MIYQVLPSISKFDAISQHAIAIDKELKNRGVETQLVAEHVGAEFQDLVKKPIEIDSFDNSQVLYHLSISNHIAEQILSSNATVDIWYHNITPAEYFENWEPFVALELRIARYQLSQLAVRARRGVAASVYSENELKENGCVDTCVMPVLFDAKTKVATSSFSNSNVKMNASKVILAVGRYAPHKRIEKLIETFSIYLEEIDPKAQLHLVGSKSSRWYQESIFQLINALKIKNHIHFHEHISDADLASLYARADVFFTMSEHEGFCVPLVEAMHNSLPIVSSDGGAISETLNGAGIVLDIDAELIEYVAALDLAINNSIVRADLIEASKKSSKSIDLDIEIKRAADWVLEHHSDERSEEESLNA